ncbi:TetR family transcriptional regulator [Rhodoferax ferrireducens]|uniref:TetR family transcriptional regulator n=1 Tax=Rhodoferax ferrireducens TaxID=192843 RepID=UPI000E0CEE46|nr:TetR family transcriptional regulator [Rhodoferax ferrireducens]
MPKLLPAKVPAEEVADAPRKRDRERTLHQLNLALIRVQRRGEKVTLKGVADEAKVSPPLINNRYPDFAEQVRAVTGRAIRQQCNEKADLLVKEREKNRKLRESVDSHLVEITRLASVNETLRTEMALLKAIADGKVARGPFGRKKEPGKM